MLVPSAPGLKVSCYKGWASPEPLGWTGFSRGRPSPGSSLGRVPETAVQRQGGIPPGIPCLRLAGLTAPLKTRCLALWALSPDY